MDDTVTKLAWEGLQKYIVVDGNMMMDGRTGEVLDPEADLVY